MNSPLVCLHEKLYLTLTLLTKVCLGTIYIKNNIEKTLVAQYQNKSVSWWQERHNE